MLPLTAWGDHYEFKTSLVGVTRPIGSTLTPRFVPLATFSWSSNFTGVSGGITNFKIFNLDPPLTPGPGSIFNMQTIPAAALPLDVRNTLIAAGAQGVSTAPEIDRRPYDGCVSLGPARHRRLVEWPSDRHTIATDIDGPSDIASITYTVDGGVLTTYTAPFAVSGDAIHTISFGSVDQSGNTETPRPSQTIQIDETPPNVLANANPNTLGRRTGTWFQ